MGPPGFSGPLVYHLYSMMIGSKIVKSMISNKVVFVNVLLPIYCHIGTSMPYLHIFVKEIIALLGAMTDKWCENFFVVGIRK